MTKWISAFILTLSISAFIHPAKAQAPLVTKEAEKPVLAPYSPDNAVSTLPSILQAIAKCESGGHQFNKDGSVLRGVPHDADVGLFQINSDVHLQKAQELGFDVFTPEGNVGFALYLYQTRGTQPWDASKSCWSKNLPKMWGAGLSHFA